MVDIEQMGQVHAWVQKTRKQVTLAQPADVRLLTHSVFGQSCDRLKLDQYLNN